ncbi:MAG: cob(I)yrinic acid a,c-diamide adenosyltransferase [Ruminococcus sp.]|nr:cob(I)yrinic acid a,c-diamide adenosyltransferase [Ruminococcus sp.]
MLHIYTGNGKGKTTAAVGLAVRAAGAGLRVCFCQMMKDGSSSEIAMLEKLGVTVKAAPSCCKFVSEMDSSEKAYAAAEHAQMLADLTMTLAMGNFDLVVIDEFFCALSAGLINAANAEMLLRTYSGTPELVLTGRGACEPYLGAADYVTEMTPVKHPYDKGVQARKGIEY